MNIQPLNVNIKDKLKQTKNRFSCKNQNIIFFCFGFKTKYHREYKIYKTYYTSLTH